jgi:hypothetical protein
MVRALDLLDGWNGKVIKSWSSALIGFEELNDFDDDVRTGLYVDISFFLCRLNWNIYPFMSDTRVFPFNWALKLFGEFLSQGYS